MADTVATWGGLEIQLVSDEVVNAIDATRSFLELLNQGLSIALEVGEIAKTFVTSNLNLARALVNELITQLRNLIRDLFSLGVFANFGDLQLLRQGTAALKGGYPAYERRMISRLNDRNDPNRPDFTQSSTVLALFFYVGVDVSFINDLINTERFAPIGRLIRAFAALFGITIGANNALPVAVNVRAEYATPDNTTSRDVALIASALAGRTRIRVVWNSAPAPGGSQQDPSPTVPASGFIVEVSCYPKGFTAAYIAPIPAGTGQDGQQARTTGVYQAGDTGQPLVIFGGEDAVTLEGDVLWPGGYTPGTSELPDGAHPLYFFRDATTPEVIRRAFGKGPEEIEGGRDVTRYFNQKRFFVTKERAIAQGLLEGNYSITLTEADLPLYCPIVNGVMNTDQAQTPRSVYVRVIPVSDQVDENNFRRARWKPRAWTSNNETIVNIDPITLPNGGRLGNNDLGTPSPVIEVLVPSTEQNLYLRALQTAIAIVTLSRSDLAAPDGLTAISFTTADPTYTSTGLEGVATEINQRLTIYNPENYYGQRSTTQSPQGFVSDLYPRIVAEADRYLRTQGALSQTVLDSLQDTFETLVRWTWSDTVTPVAAGNPALRYTVLQSLNSTNLNTPLSRNRHTTRRYFSDPAGTPSSLLEDLRVKWAEGSFGTIYHPSSVDSSPVIGPCTGAQPQYWYARDLIPDEVYAAARTVLSLTSDQTVQRQGAWMSKRVFAPRQPAGIALEVLNKTEGFLNTVLAGLQTGADAITRVIDFLEQRVMEIQELIKRIETLLDIPYQLSFPSAKVLLLITNGTSGIITGLTTAQEKPQEGANGYAGGGVLVAGSAPSILIDLLARGIRPASGG